MKFLRLFIVATTLLVASIAAGTESDFDSQLLTRNLSLVADSANRGSVPIMLVMSSEVCSFCERLRVEVIAPMLLSGSYNERVVIKEFKIDDFSQVVDFDGSHTSSSVLSVRYGISVTPTIIFLDSIGNEVAKRIVGMANADFINAYIDRSLDVAMQNIQKPQISSIQSVSSIIH